MVTRDELLDSALQTLNADRTASLAQIAEGAGISRATLHRHIDSRNSLILDLCGRAHDRWADMLDAARSDAVAATGDAAEIEATLRSLLADYLVDADVFGFTLTEPTIEDDRELLARSRELTAREQVLLAAAQRAGVLRADVPTAWISWQIFGLLVAARDALRSGDVAPRTLTELTIDTFWKGSGS